MYLEIHFWIYCHTHFEEVDTLIGLENKNTLQVLLCVMIDCLSVVGICAHICSRSLCASARIYASSAGTHICALSL
jgi:hypothetical protein